MIISYRYMTDNDIIAQVWWSIYFVNSDASTIQLMMINSVYSVLWWFMMVKRGDQRCPMSLMSKDSKLTMGGSPTNTDDENIHND